MNARLQPIDYAIVAVYLAFVLGTGWVLKRRIRNSADFLTTDRSMPAWVAGLAFMSANLGAQEVIGMGASGAKYGLMTSHFYWVGAVPAMVFLALFMMPFYYGSRARSVPEYLKLRFDEKTRAYNALTFAFMTLVSSGISMHALASLLSLLLGWNYTVCITAAAAVVLVYVLLGGLASTIYNEVLQFCLIVAGFVPLSYVALRDVGGWSGLQTKLAALSSARGFAPDAWTTLWVHTGSAAANPMGVEWFGLAMGLAVVLSCGYWCTDFLVIQRALAARSMSAAQRAPLIATVPKMIFPLLLIVPGMIAAALNYPAGHLLPMTPSGSVDYNMSIPALLIHYFPAGLLGLGFTALIASFMSGMAGNVTAFNTVWTYDIYQSYLARGRTDRHYLWVGHAATVIGIVLAVATAFIAARYDNIMDLLQLVFGFVNAPLFATFLLGMFWRRATGHGAFYGLIGGTLAALLFHGLSLARGDLPGVKGAWLGSVWLFRSEMSQNFYVAIAAFAVCMSLTVLISLLTPVTRSAADLQGLIYAARSRSVQDLPWYRTTAFLGLLILLAVLVLNLVFR